LIGYFSLNVEGTSSVDGKSKGIIIFS